MRIIKETNINFMGMTKAAIIGSVILISLGIISLIIKGGPKYGIDFTGGVSLGLKFEQPIRVGEVRSILSGIGFGNSEIKAFATGNEILIRLQQQEDMDLISNKIIEELRNKLANNPFEIRSKDTVGPRIGSELRNDAIKAIIISLILILIYISWRFEFRFAVGAVVALFHDVLITLGLFSIFNFEVSLSVVAAFLTLVGYSLNDTIVVFDRIRENLKVMRKESSLTIFNKSINQTLSRTILTALTTLFVVTIIFFFGGEVIHGFSFALLVGIIVGTYSSIFIASPVAYAWYLRSEAKAGLAVR
ncbi:MAG: protein translocase subunit SecF [candidate division KSB1 bacterium]|nr:protein translocase subunit SecF [candidate division KSB1 bacterium]MDZ7333981.1 protein translocase subunit SecF [candidate division KSB1 bacterium]MDZ7357979.1 protein translocase subunit SecF [candidate division KSB1 bacterium]MDZ7399966.1 protein translocase subunit SecF [candidate division KSB1 bacterium]